MVATVQTSYNKVNTLCVKKKKIAFLAHQYQRASKVENMYLLTPMTENSHIFLLKTKYIKTTIITPLKRNTKAGLLTVRQGSLPSG